MIGLRAPDHGEGDTAENSIRDMFELQYIIYFPPLHVRRVWRMYCDINAFGPKG
ncbi:hypothetical protein HETIRDRAFT_419604 [Heterobasidion irregulare TC 32-1]|uniref:Uncharacterized protein n=1 Tax=Heterobasidion irregulare (strain TC 32-1) TaxID=747525 RepID=W4K4L0_HETIT|nr:uncharacterized protein HETIRDRAFT_419604 [Heterobasidion irregulare TC 32-1]ETW79986.1 hypothetical protein HETIRDRAFT_419604 [Heterobasidion irregulare TC 32-1]